MNDTKDIMLEAVKAAVAVLEEHGRSGAFVCTLEGEDTEVFFVSPNDGGEELLARIRAEINSRAAQRVQ